MSIKLLLFPLALVASLARAQTSPIITAADMPSVGDTLRLSQASPLLPSGAPALTLSGANQTWNYAGLVALAQRVDRYTSLNTAAPLQQFSFGLLGGVNRATLVAPRTLPVAAGPAVPVSDPLEFFNSSAADFRSVGFGITVSGTGLPITYASQAQQDVVYRFPLSYASTRAVSNSFFEIAVPGSGSASQERQRTTQPDGWGTLTTPFGTFRTVRVVSTIADHDKLAVGTDPAQTVDLPLRREYKWLANGIHVPVLTITTATVAGQEAIVLVEYRDVYRRFVRLAARSATAGPALGAYPNPSAVGADVQLAEPSGSGPLTLTATDLVGRQLFSRRIERSAASGLTLGAAALGNYRGVLLLTVRTATGDATTYRLVRE